MATHEIPEINFVADNNQIANIDLMSTRGYGLAAKDLTEEKSFVKYLKLLKAFSKRYAVFIAALDTPCGPAFTRAISHELMGIGLNVDLSQKFRHSYAAAINAGELVFERVAQSLAEPVEHEFMLGGLRCILKSKGFGVRGRKTTEISIDGRRFSSVQRGLHFVVFDIVTKTLVDDVNFDTFDASFVCRRPGAFAAHMIDYQNRHPDIFVACFSLPKFPEEKLSPNEKFICDYNVGLDTILANLDKPIFALNKYFTTDEIEEVLKVPRSYHDIYGVRRFEDTSGPYVNTFGGRRVTAWQPSLCKRTIYMVGGCSVFGVGSSDEGTVASQLQRLLNELEPDKGFRVENYGFYIFKPGVDTQFEKSAILNALPAKPNDIVLVGSSRVDGLPFFDLEYAARRPHGYGEIFFDLIHLTECGYSLVAEKFFECLRHHNFFQHGVSFDLESTSAKTILNPPYKNLNKSAFAELEEYKNELRAYYDSKFAVKVGAVVMNCNPFTLGHRHLVEKAAAQVDHLMVFVVEEDKSIFPFKDRINLVDRGLIDLKNITIIPSGRFIISSLTFSEYFNKSEIQDMEVDATVDLELFAKEIAPCLDISVRFAGEEPFDNVTRQYNDAMRVTLPKYGIEFFEIPRASSSDNVPISASRVRKLLDERKFEEIAQLVPKTTLDYLMDFRTV
jgi:[citrate (pro-3S)-lyase] ligase